MSSMNRVANRYLTSETKAKNTADVPVEFNLDFAGATVVKALSPVGPAQHGFYYRGELDITGEVRVGPENATYQKRYPMYRDTFAMRAAILVMLYDTGNGTKTEAAKWSPRSADWRYVRCALISTDINPVLQNALSSLFTNFAD